MTRLSIITAVHNQLEMNRWFVEHLQRCTRLPSELIIIDNASTDGSAEFFESVGAKVIRNAQNFSYPYTQNQGIAAAQGDWLAFLNNDIVVPPDWDSRLVANAELHGLDALTVCGIERIETPEATHALRRRWKRASLPVRFFGAKQPWLGLSHRWMYGDWERFCRERAEQFEGLVIEGYVGNSVLMNRRAIDRIGLWDERIQAADADLFLRAKKRAVEVGDIRPLHIALDVFVHHYIRVTLRARPPAFADATRLIPIDRKWSAAELARLSADAS
ncbi:glycosyltransferase [Rhizobacter sp. SG703]|uniref:glycosyltransferase family 2 protein n=1 Tax=Rhizobacter sp. SG703 TaxID=2587140 RepID=UPI0014472AC3|nr:glycosyltransferase [Rhizobacter sp. SG703]NKI93426.1 GT2 family glycosyltransferase [Rhizobacter sp. SG703]